MNKLLIALFAGLLSTQAIGAVSDVDRALVEKGFNVFRNGGAENGRADWTASGGTITAVSSAKASGQLGISWDSNASGQTLVLSSVANIPDGLKGRNGAALCKIRVPSGTATHTFTVDDGTNNLASAQVVPSQTTFQLAIVNFVYPNSAVPLRFKFTSVASNEPAIEVDECVGTDAFNISQVSQATLWGGVNTIGATNCSWSQTSGTFPADSDCNTATAFGNATAPATKIPAIRFPNGLPPGEYLIIASGGIGCTNASNNCTATYSFTDGTNKSNGTHLGGGYSGVTNTTTYFTSVVGRLNYSTAQGDITIQPTIDSPITGSAVIINSSSTISFQILVYRFPSSSEIAYRPEVLNWRVDANISGANPNLGTSAVTSYTEITDASLTLTNNTTGTISAQIPCSSTNPSTGTTCSVGSESVGVAFNLPRAGSVVACASFTHNVSGGGGGSAVGSFFQIVETPNNAQTILQQGKTRIGSRNPSNSAANNNNQIPHRNCGTFTFDSAGLKTLRLMYEQVVTGTGLESSVLADASSTEGQRDIHWEVYPTDQQFSTPVFVGSVTSPGDVATKFVSAKVGATGTVSNEIGDPFNGDCTNANPAVCTFNTGLFGSAVNCSVSVAGMAANSCWCGLDSDPTTTSVSVKCNTDSGSSCSVGDNFNILCHGY